MGRVLILMKKEFLQFFRSVPLLVIVLYVCTLDVYMASKFSMDLENYPLAIYDMDRSPLSRQLVEKIRPPYFDVVGQIDEESQIEVLIDQGTVGAVLVIPNRFGADIAAGKTSQVQLILDATSSNTSQLAANYLFEVITAFNSQAAVQAWKVSPSRAEGLPLLETRTSYVFNSSLDESWNMALIEFLSVLTLIAMLLPASAMVNEKEYGTIEQLMVAPIRPIEIMAAKLIPMMLIFMLSSFITVYCILIPLVGIPLRGSILDFLVLTIVYTFATSGLGLMISTVSDNLSQTVMLTLLIVFPVMFLSGSWVPVESMPAWLQVCIKFSPLTYYLKIGTAIFLKGNSLLFMWRDFLSLLVLGLGIFGVGALRFEKGL